MDYDIDDLWLKIKEIATKKYGLTFYEPLFELVTFDDMIRIFCSGLPICYNHWYFGKEYVELYNKYKANTLPVALECIFNTDPTLCYLLETNTRVKQILVMCHAAVGHSTVFKNNVIFQEHTKARSALSMMKQFQTLVTECEELHGEKQVEDFLDLCHALSSLAVHHCNVNRTNKTYEKRIKKRQQELLNSESRLSNTLNLNKKNLPNVKSRFYEENVLAFVGKNSSRLKPWQREIVNGYCALRQYLYPQPLMKIIHEGFANFWESELMDDLYDQKVLSDGEYIEYLIMKASSNHQLDWDSKYYSGFNPYALGYKIFEDIKRICTSPTEEDKKWFPQLIGKNWIDEICYAAYNFRDSSFILQYLSPKVMRDLKLFSIDHNRYDDANLINNIHDYEGYEQIRHRLAMQFDYISNSPTVYINGCDFKKSRTLYITIKCNKNRQLIDPAAEVFKALRKLWGHPIFYYLYNDDDLVYKGNGNE